MVPGTPAGPEATSGQGGGRWSLGSGGRIGHALAMVLALDLVHVAAGGIMFGALGLKPAEVWSGSHVVTGISGISGLVGVLGVVWLGIVVLGRVSWRELGWQAEGMGRSAGLGLAGFAALAASFIAILWAAGLLADVDVLGTICGYSASQRLLFLVIGLSAAIVEESLFRGYLQPALAAKLGGVGGVAAGAVVFSLYHLFMGPSAINLIGKFVMGCILGAMRGRDRPLAAPALAHFLLWQIIGSM